MLHNLTARLNLVRTALGRRFIYSDIVAMARDYGIHYDDVRGDVHPLEFVRLAGLASAGSVPPDWSALESEAARFTPEGFPAWFNSEPSVARFLGELVHSRRAATVVELGCFVGWTTAHIATALKAVGGGRVYALDTSPDFLAVMAANLQRCALGDFVVPVLGHSEDPAVSAELPRQADVIFIDTGHSHPQTLNEIQAHAPRLAPGGLMVLHDSTGAPGVRRSLLELSGFRKMTFATERSNGVTVLLRPA